MLTLRRTPLGVSLSLSCSSLHDSTCASSSSESRLSRVAVAAVTIRNLQVKQAKQDIPPEELKTIPQEYRRHLKVFSEKAAACLPPDRPWNHAIELKPNAPASIRGRIYPLTQLENEALEKHIKEQEAKGYI